MWTSVPIRDHKVSSAISMQSDIEANFDGKRKVPNFQGHTLSTPVAFGSIKTPH